MRARFGTVVIAAVVGLACLPSGASAQPPVPGPCETGSLPGGALSLICVPNPGWNGELIVFAHGYVAPDEPLGFYHLTLSDGTFVPALVQGLGYAFATTSYKRNGLAILDGVEDIKALVAEFVESGHALPLRTHLVGVSEGGDVATLLAERSPELFSDALALCGPIGSFQTQLNYFLDFRVLFDYFFPGVIPGSPIAIPPEVMDTWDSYFVPAITAALIAHPDRALELMSTSKAAFDPGNPATIVNTTLDVLWYNVFATNDAIAILGGNPAGNRTRWYYGSRRDFLLNLRVERFSADLAARLAVREYETSGGLSIPLVTLHTVGDDVVPIWHELLYFGKFDPVARGRFIPVPISRYGHCSFTTKEVLAGFLLAASLP